MAPISDAAGSGDAALSPEQLLSHAPFVRALARALVRDDAAADDLAQESLLAALTKPPRQLAQPGRSHSVRAWLVGVVRNLARQTKRGDVRRLERESAVGLERPPPPASPREAAERLELFGRLVAAVQRLDEPIRATILRRHFDGATAQEIATEEGIPLETVRTRIKRGLERLRVMLDETAGGRASWSAIASTVFMEAATVTTKTKLLLAAAAVVVVTTTAVVWPVLHSGSNVGAGASAGSTRSTANGANATNPAAPESKLAAARTTEARNLSAAPPADPLATWIVRGRVHSFPDSPRPHVRIRARLWEGLDQTGEPRVDVHFASDDAGRLEWPLHPPAGAVIVALEPDEPDSYQFGDERFVAAGAAPPQDLDLRCDALDTELEGVVFGPDGAPAVDAHVSVLHRIIDCDEHGEFSAKMPNETSRQGGVQVVGWAPGSAETMVVAKPGPRGERAHVELHLTPGFTVRGRVTDAANAPIAGATISSFGLRVSKATSDAQGDYCLEHVPARDPTVPIDARADGYARADASVSGGGGDAHLDFVLKRGLTVRGRVVAPDGHPAAGAAVALGFSPFAYDKLSIHAREDGSFEIHGARPGRAPLNLYVEWSGAAPLAQPITIPADAADGSAMSDVVLQLTSSHFAAGHVEDERGRPIAGIYVMFQKGENTQDCYGHSDARGDFRVDSLPEGPFTLRAYGNGWAETRQEKVAVDRADLKVTMRRSGRAAGRIVDGATGSPIGRFKIRFCNAKLASGESEANFYSSDWREAGRTIVDAGGRFEVGGESSMPPDSILGLEVSAEGYAPTLADHVRLASEPDRDALVVELFRGGAIEGIVVDRRDGRPVGGALIRLVNDQMPFDANHDSYANSRPTAKSDEAGRFRLERVPSGKATLVVEHPDFASFHDDFEVPRGGTTEARTIRLGRAGGIDGIVLDDAGAPISGASIELQNNFYRPLSADGNFTATELPEFERAIQRSATSDAAGRFSFAPLPPGRYRVTRIAQDGAVRCHAVELVVVVEPDANRQVRLGANGTAKLRGRIHGAAGSPRSFLVIVASASNASSDWPDMTLEQRSHDDAFEFSGLPAGRYDVFATGEDWRGSLEINLAEGATLDATVEVAKAR